jgi:hypothetical protein
LDIILFPETSLGLERYEAVFRENEINDKVLPKLTAEDLKEPRRQSFLRANPIR